MPPILFVHGFWHGGWCWDEHFVPWFRERGYEATAITLRRHDQRHAPGLRTTRIRDYVEDVANAAAKMPSPPVVVGHSMGGFVTQKYLEDHGAPAAVLMASVPPSGVMGATLRTAARHPLRFVAVNLTWSLYGLIKTPGRAREMFFGRELTDEEVSRYQSKMTDDAYLAYLDLLLFVRPNIDTVRRTPLLVLGGDADWVISPAEVARTAATYGAERATFPGAHDLMLEPGWEKVAERIDAFIRSKAGAATG
ncbi:MAG TPA: alpha/beta fold hydrolase [Candidatus Dormibacteraeota bacterium]|nr:alpha/beta fold hydrolase [Candidatus Dormibacteraeota bacterium]